MKKTLLLFFLSVLIIGCSADSSIIKNRIDRTVYVSYTKEGTTGRFIAEIPPQQDITFSGFLDELATIKSIGESEIIDNSFRIDGQGLIRTIREATKIEITIRNLLSESQYQTESRKIYLVDLKHKIGQYYPSNESQIELKEGLTTTAYIYGNYQLSVIDEYGNEVTTFGGYPVNIRIENGVVYIE